MATCSKPLVPATHRVYGVYVSRKDEILAAAWRCFERGGDAGLSLRGVAGEVGLTPMAIYRHFADRQALLDSLVLEAVAEWRQRVAAIARAPADEWLGAIAEAYLQFALRRPSRFEAAFLVPSRVALRYPDDFFAGDSPALALQLALIGDLRRTAHAGDDEAGSVLVTMIALAQGLVTLFRTGRISGDEDGFRDLYRRVVGRFIGSLTSELVQ